MNIPSGNSYKYGNSAVNLQQGVKFDRALVLSEFGPGKERQTKIDGSGVEGVGSGI